MDMTLTILLATAVSVAFIHTLVGIDHTLPFIVIGRARAWPLRKVLGLTALCGVGHVLTSVLLGGIGIAAGVALDELDWVQSQRGSIAAWLLIGFGVAYAAWALVRNHRDHSHSHVHVHDDGTVHDHDHDHHTAHLHAHTKEGAALTGWALFLIFAFGPCESLIPLLMVPAASMSWWSVALVATVFGAVTVATMLAVVTVGYLGLRPAVLRPFERHAHTFAGVAIALSGAAIQLFGI